MDMIDYLKWRGDLTFDKDPFNDVDNLLISQMTYVEMQDVFAKHKKMSVAQLSKEYFKDIEFNEADSTKNYAMFSQYALKKMAESKRFKDCMVYNYISILHKDSTEQFAALMMDIPDGTTVISFRGTDDTLIGWHEDLMLSYTSIASEEDALKYVNENFNIFKKYRIIGHSKGGYLAIYAAVKCNPFFRLRIKEIISNDGPGLRPGSYKEEDYEKVKDRYKLIVPERDGIGTIYELAQNKLIAECSTSNLISAHSMSTWNVLGNRIVEADGGRIETLINYRSIRQFLDDTSPEERELFVKELFARFDELKIKTVSDLANSSLGVLIKTISKLMEMDGDAKATGIKALKAYYDNIGSDLNKSLSNKSQFFSKANETLNQMINTYFRKKIEPDDKPSEDPKEE